MAELYVPHQPVSYPEMKPMRDSEKEEGKDNSEAATV